MGKERTYARVSDASAWTGRSLQGSREWLRKIDDENIRDMERALASIRDRNLVMEEIRKEDFPLPSMHGALSDMARELEFGRGFALLRGLPVGRWGVEDATTIYWGLSTHLGTPTSQSRRGNHMMSVRDAGLPATAPNLRGPLTNARLYYHSDFADIVGLMCIHPAKEGGVSRICSSMTIYNALVDAGRRDLIDALYDGYLFDRKGEEGPGVSPVSEAPFPMLSWHAGRLSFRYVPNWAETAAKRTGTPWSGVQRAALDEVNRLSNLSELYLDMDFQVGDVQYLNNYSVLHSRTDFVDHDEPERKRFLQRIWLRASLGRQLASDFDHLFGSASTRDGIPEVVEHMAAYSK